MKLFHEYLKVVVESCKSAIEQMTDLKVIDIHTKEDLEEKGSFPFAHIINYTDDEKVNGNFILAFESVHDALRLASAISKTLGIGAFSEPSEDSADLLNEFINIVVGRTISTWDDMGLKIKFGTPVFETDYKYDNLDKSLRYIIEMDVSSNTDNSSEQKKDDKIILRINFLEQKENLIKNKKILLVDDSRVMRGIICKMLKNAGAIVKEAEDGEKAIQTHRTFNPDLTLMDINMPKMNGLEAIAQINKFNQKARFIILSSSSRKDEIITAKTLHVSGYLVKPFKPEILIAKLIATL